MRWILKFIGGLLFSALEPVLGVLVVGGVIGIPYYFGWSVLSAIGCVGYVLAILIVWFKLSRKFDSGSTPAEESEPE